MKWIEQCIRSILKTNLDINLIVIDNASQDGTVDFVRNNFESVLVLEQAKNIGFGRANNIGLTYALEQKCDYVFLLNQDAFVEPDTIRKLIEVSQNNPEFGILSPLHLNSLGTGLDESFHYYIKNAGGDEFVEDCILNKGQKEIYELKMVNAAAWLLPAKTLKTVGGFSPLFFLYGEDDNYCQRAFYHNLKIGFTSKSSIRHDSNNNYSGEFDRSNSRYLQKFSNRLKIKYGNVNTDEYKSFPDLKFYYLKKALFSFFKMDIKNYKLYIKKSMIVANLDLKNNVLKERKARSNYLFNN